MELIFIRHGHGEHLKDYPNRLNTMHPSLTDYGKYQVTQLRNEIRINPDDLVLVSPTKRTIETAAILKNDMDFIISPLVGPRMFPQNPEFPILACDHILSKSEISNLYGVNNIMDYDLDCWVEGINRIEQDLFEVYAQHLLDWIVGESYNKTFIISHDGTITNYRILLGEKRLTRKDFLGEAGIYRINL
ncbi:phosphoglycerate mutase family protein [Paenibacillus lemnae]|uniref:Histidine phosphatase family protein n=1 Tax=Paenibacillus lemnae TaxID=1330551 RepID=A0A848MA73_PAELE|nr:histidine phosphatase family protein [Paenibacillus lemnae]NMO97101.1 histidine phosphatase family protein [Paenibacillus lemnae]